MINTKSLLNKLVIIDDNGLVIYEPTTQEKWNLIKEVRDELLKQSDWVVIKSNELGQPIPKEWVDYRQALRDIPQTYATPEEVIFPLQPM